MTCTTLSLPFVSSMDQSTFIATFANIFEHSPWVAERAWFNRPFNTIDALHQSMVNVVTQASQVEKQALINAHPELGGKQAQTGTLTPASTQEQRGAGLDQWCPDELRRLRSLNAQYMEKFNFPFILAVKGRDRYQIMDAIQTRLTHSLPSEFQTCLDEIAQIARFRLNDLFVTDHP